MAEISGGELRVLAAAIARVAQDLGRTMPAPRGAPFFGLDLPVADPVALDAFSGPGIFRKYQRAVVLGSGLGGTARWWSVRLGCRLVGVDPDPHLSAAAAWLNERCGAGGATHFCAGSLDALPLADQRFTHAWSTAGVPPAAVPAVLCETFRVLRPAGQVTLEFAAEPGGGGPSSWWIEQARAVGFAAAEIRDVPCASPPEFLLAALARLRVLLAGELPPARVTPLLDVISAGRAEATPARRAQLRAHRPS